MALQALSPDRGVGATIWAQVIADELQRHDAARARVAAAGTNGRTLDRLYGSALVLVVAIAQVLAFEQRVRGLTGDAELEKARKRFDTANPQARDVRDIAAHLDDYAVGKGHRQTGTGRAGGAALPETQVQSWLLWTDSGDSQLDLAGEPLNLHEAARAAMTLAELVEQVRGKYLHRAGQRADKKRRRRWGLDD